MGTIIADIGRCIKKNSRPNIELRTGIKTVLPVLSDFIWILILYSDIAAGSLQLNCNGRIFSDDPVGGIPLLIIIQGIIKEGMDIPAGGIRRKLER